MDNDFADDIAAVQSIGAVPRILEIVCRSTGMGFAAVARVTEKRWVCCAVRDDIEFGLQPGGELKVETTICHEIRQSHRAVVIDHVAEDEVFAGHHTPALYGFQSYHGSADQPVDVTASTDNGTFELSVANSGDPIPAEVMKQLFQPFYHGAIRPAMQGLGLGLFIASEIARAHGGTLTVASSDIETRFTFRMPTS
jgi:light-regulated signal transduction histidine kinase (bacteriophytochrome)